MFCNACGSQLSEGAQFCPLCGKPVKLAETPPAAPAGVTAPDTTAVLPALDGSAEATTPMPAVPPAYPPAAPEYPAPGPAYPQPLPDPGPGPVRARSAAPIIIAIVLVVLLVMGGGAFVLLRSGILGGSGAKVDQGTATSSGDGGAGGDTASGGDTSTGGDTGGTTDGTIGTGDNTPPTGDPVDITPGAGSFSASSTLKGYPVGQLVDGKLDTCWAEGVSGYGNGQSITIDMGGEVWVSEVRIVPGYLKVDTKNNVDRWFSNGRVASAKLVFSDGRDSATFTLDPNNEGWQTMKLDAAVKTTSVKVVILTTAPATTGTDHDAEDTSVSEIEVFGFMPR